MDTDTPRGSRRPPGRPRAPKPLSVLVAVHLDAATAGAMRTRAEANERTLSQEVRLAIRTYLAGG